MLLKAKKLPQVNAERCLIYIHSEKGKYGLFFLTFQGKEEMLKVLAANLLLHYDTDDEKLRVKTTYQQDN